jgi:hypothetical protein
MITVEMISATMNDNRTETFDTMEKRLAVFPLKGVVKGYATGTGTGPGLSEKKGERLRSICS